MSTDQIHARNRRRPHFEARLATWLRLAAAPAFGTLAGLMLLNPGFSSLCVSTSPTFAFDDMGLMYLLMAIVHLPAWLTLAGQGLDGQAPQSKDTEL